MRPLKSGESAAGDWQRINQLAADARFGRLETISLKDKAQYGAPRWAGNGFHPFKLYQIPSCYVEGADPTTDWRRFWVRSGQVLGVDAIGTDGAPAPDEDVFGPDAGSIFVPEGVAKFWFWLEVAIDGSSAVVRYSDDPTDTVNVGGENDDWESDNPWTSFPVPDAAHIPIGWVDTVSRAADGVAVVRQLLRADVVFAGGGGSPCAIYG